MRIPPFALLAAPLFLLACGGDDSGDLPGPVTTTGTGGGGSTTTGEGGSGSGGAGPSTLFPLAVGYAWTYEVVSVGAGSVCAAGQYTSTVIDSGPLAGKDAFEVSSWCTGAAGSNQYALGEGDLVYLFYNGDWLHVIDIPLEEGHTWSYFNTSFTWRNAGTVTVPAGTFDDCWTAEQDVSYTAYSTYCRGAGLVRSYSEDLTGAGWDTQLTTTTGL